MAHIKDSVSVALRFDSANQQKVSDHRNNGDNVSDNIRFCERGNKVTIDFSEMIRVRQLQMS